MAYRVGSGKDARKEKGFTEQDFLDRFRKRQSEIEDYKNTHGGDLEGAYQAVTGEPWPSGRSVKIKNGVPQMTKDRTVKSVLGKYVVPAAAAYFAGPHLAKAIGAAGPGIAKAGAGAVGGGGDVSGGGGGGFNWKDLIGPAIGAVGAAGASAFARDPFQRRESFRGTSVDPEQQLKKSSDYLDELRKSMSETPPIDLSGASANLPDDPGGRVPTPRRRLLSRPYASGDVIGGSSTSGMQPPGSAPPTTPVNRRAGALALLRSLRGGGMTA